MELQIPNTLIQQFRALIQDRCGLYFRDYGFHDLQVAIQERLKVTGLKSPQDYYQFLTDSKDRGEEFREILNLLTVNHTYFFRNKAHFTALSEHVLPEIIAKKRRMAGQIEEPLKLNIWSAGCSTGEEPYSIAMVLRDVLEDLDQWEINIYATDVSSAALTKAREGRYRASALERMPPEYQKKYFTPTGKSSKMFQLSPSIKEMVKFDFFNLIEQNFPIGFDIIFCRNVLIYFDLETVVRVIKKFYKSLSMNDFLFIGYSETLHYISDLFKCEFYGDAVLYRKVSEGSMNLQSTRQDSLVQPEEVAELLSRAERDSKAEYIKEGAADETLPAEELIVDIMKLIHMKQYPEALQLIDQGLQKNERSVDLYFLSAEIFASQGNVTEAQNRIEKALTFNAFYAPAHYLAGTIALNQEDFDSAKKSFRKTLYINVSFPLAAFSLATIYKQQGLVPQAMREYRNTLKILSGYKKDHVLPYSGGIVAGALEGVCTENLERLKYD